MPPYNLFGIEGSTYEKARIAVLPIPYDSTSSYRSGSREGPAAIIEASRNLELYHIETKSDASDLGIYTLEHMAPDFSSPENMVKRISKEVSLLLDDKKIPLLLGGEHTIAVGAVDALAKRSDFTVLQFDAHSDSREELYGSRYCHACTMARVRELCRDCYSIGVRSIDRESAASAGKRTIYMKDVRSMTMKRLAALLAMGSKKNIYLSFDFDVLDSGEMPSTGTPEPDGFRFGELMELFSMLLPKKRLIGMDFSELLPTPGLAAPDFLAAKLIFNVLAYAYQGKREKS
jgi:agmatinase